MNNVIKDIRTFANNIAVSRDNDAANQRVRTDKSDPETCKFERTAKVSLSLLNRIVLCGDYCFFTTLDLPRYFASPFLPTRSWVRLQLETLSDLASAEFE